MNAFHDHDSTNSICGTAVSVRNIAPTTVSVDVEWFDHAGVSMGLSTRAISSEQLQVFWTNDNVHLHPFTADGTVTDTSDFAGWANVNAEDPRVLASAAIVCRDVAGAGTSDIEAMVGVPTYPVGATMEYFQAGMPMHWRPPMATPEVPE
jgi:hypothetical protein